MAVRRPTSSPKVGPGGVTARPGEKFRENRTRRLTRSPKLLRLPGKAIATCLDGFALTFLSFPVLSLPALAALGMMLLGLCGAAAETVPLPRPRPFGLNPATDIPLPPLRPSIAPAAEAPKPSPSSCQLRLPDIAVVEMLPSVIAANGCGIEDPVKLSGVTTTNGVRNAISPPATLRCTTAEAVARWVREDIAPIAASLGAPLSGVANFDSYECRGQSAYPRFPWIT